VSFSLKDFRIHIPRNLIAQYPSEVRGQSRLLVVDTKKGTLIDDFFINLVNYITSSDCIVYNNAKVINARLFGVKNGTGAHLEVLLTRRLSNTEWMCIIRPARRVKKGTKISIEGRYNLEIIEYLGEGLFRACFSKPVNYEELKKVGEIPLPKYIKRKPVREIDEHRYQTIYSNKYGAVASPTAGLHFSQKILEKIQQTGAITVPITLYVDWSTFKPVREEDYRTHKIHSEIYEITENSAHILNRCITEKRRMLCVGTTSVRTIETAVTSEGRVVSGRGETDLFIYPGYDFKLVDALITNFHIPDSTLILLVAAFAGKELIEKAYNHAVSKGYRFFSYGDAMLIKK
jgi:S-adenosylmethionine:tRNA ribosyltransferase-isomerase